MQINYCIVLYCIIAFAAILRSTFNSVIGLQFPISSREPSSLGIKVITPLRCETVSSLSA